MRKKKGKAAALLLAAALSLSAVFGAAVPAAASTTADKVPDPRATATVTPAEPGVGSPFGVDLSFTQNVENFDCKDVDHIKVDVTEASGSISVSHKGYYAENISEDSGDNNISTLSYDLHIPQKYLKRSGSNYGVLKFEITYYSSTDDKDVAESKSDSHDLKFTVEYLVFSKLDSSSDTENDGRLTVSSYKLDHTPVKEGETFSLTLTVKNSSSLACTHAVSVLDLSGAEGVSISGETDTKTLGSLNAGATATVTYPLKCLSKMTTGSYPVAVSLSADDVTAASSKIYLPITGTKAGKDDTGEVGDSKPQLIIESYDFGGKAVTGGQEFNLVMNVRNTGSVPIDNCKMTVGSDTGDSDSDKSTAVGSVFTPSQSSNTFFIPSLGSNATVKKEIALLPKADAAPNSYGVIVNFSYDAVVDGKRQTLTSEETITIPLAQPIRFEVGDPVLSNPFYMGEPGQISIDYVNKGKSKVYNVSVELKGNFDTEESSQYIGNLDSGASDSFQANLTPQKEGSLSGTATFSYEDASGKVLTVAKDFSCDVQAAEAPTMGGPDGLNPDGTPGAKPEKSGPGWKLWAGIAAGAAVVAAGTVFFLKKRKAKKMRLLEEAEDYDDTPGGGI
ncbi:COG1361 S-layer family protein [Caproicibacter sp.]|uniref:COG1361 S-layer family protein n=1 Tax=Caproicibacter sp. TaxID=2814884 RepID=UPI003988A9BC